MSGLEVSRGSFLSVAWKVVAALAAFLALFLVVGLALPATWEAERTVTIDAAPDAVFPWVAELERWERWTVWGTVTSTLSGPEEGVGATRSWDDPFLGEGVFRVTDSDPPHGLSYRVDVEGGALRTEGTFELEGVRGFTRVTWRERGDFGANPLMGYAALTMDEVQGAELERGLARLRALVETGALPDSLALPDSMPPSAG